MSVFSFLILFPIYNILKFSTFNTSVQFSKEFNKEKTNTGCISPVELVFSEKILSTSKIQVNSFANEKEMVLFKILTYLVNERKIRILYIM